MPGDCGLSRCVSLMDGTRTVDEIVELCNSISTIELHYFLLDLEEKGFQCWGPHDLPRQFPARPCKVFCAPEIPTSAVQPPSRHFEPISLKKGGYAASQRIRKRIEEFFGWTKLSAGHRKTRFRGLPRVRFAFTLAAAAYNLIRLPKLIAA